MQILFLFLIGYLGWNAVKLMVPTLHKAEHIGLSFMVGMGLFAIIYYVLVLYLRLLPISSYLIILLTISFTMGLLAHLAKSKITYYHISKLKLSWIEIILLLIFALVFLYIAAQNWYWPPYISDSIHLYDFRAKRLLDNDIAGFYNGAKYIVSQNYPPFTSLLHYFYYAFKFINPQNGYTLLLGSFLVTLFGYVERVTGSRLKGILAATLTLITPSIWWNAILAITNIPLMEYFSLAVLYICDYKNNKHLRSTWILSGFLLGISSFIRQEAIWIPILGFSLLFAIKTKNVFRYITMVAISLTLSSVWPISVSWTQPAQHIQQETVAIARVIYNINQIDFKPAKVALIGLQRSWGPIVILFYLILLIQNLILKKKIIFPIQLIGILMSLALFIGFMGFAGHFGEWATLSDAVYRMGTILIPIFWVGIIISPVWKRLEFKKEI